MPIFYPSGHPSTIVRPEERHRSPSARKDELQGRARKSECPKRSVATQVFRISASAARLSAWVTVALTFFCLLFLCQDKKRRRTGALPLFPVSRQEKNRGFAPFTPTFFSSLDGRKEGKRRSRRQGRRPSFPGTRPNFPAPAGDVRDAGQVFWVRYAPAVQQLEGRIYF